MEPILLQETTLAPAVQLSNEECDLLLELVPSISVSPSRRQPGHYDLKPGSQIGTVQLGTRTIEIRPKVPVDRVFFMLSYAMSRAKLPAMAPPIGTDTSVLEVVIPAFRAHLKRAVSRGLLQGYRVEESAENFVRGQIRFGDQIRRRYGVPLPAEIRYDDYTEDIVENRVLRAAIARLGRIRVRHEPNRLALREFDSVFVNVSRFEYSPNALPTILYTRLNEHYRPALNLALMILKNCSLELRRGGIAGTAILFDMNGVVEDFIVTALREALGLSPRTFPKNCSGRELCLDYGGKIRLEPDISWWEAGRCVFVGDVKYKDLGEADKLNPDIYQMLAYCVATGLREGVLVYAATDGKTDTNQIRRLEKQISVVRLPLTGSPELLLRRIGDLARRIEKRRQVPEPLAG